MTPARRLTLPVLALCLVALVAAAFPFLSRSGPGPVMHRSIRGVEVTTHGFGPYRDMPADVAVQGLAQDAITLVVAIPFVLLALVYARRGGRAAHLALTGGVAYLFVQYFLYLGMGTFNELFLVWVAAVVLASQVLLRLLLARPAAAFSAPVPRTTRRFVGGFLVLNGALITLLWLQVVVPPLVAGTLYPAGLAHFTTMVVQGFDLALFLPASFVAGYRYARNRPAGDLLGPVYAIFVTLQMLALLAKITWMSAIGASAGPALVIIPTLLAGAAAAAVLSLRPHRGTVLDG